MKTLSIPHIIVRYINTLSISMCVSYLEQSRGTRNSSNGKGEGW